MVVVLLFGCSTTTITWKESKLEKIENHPFVKIALLKQEELLILLLQYIINLLNLYCTLKCKNLSLFPVWNTSWD